MQSVISDQLIAENYLQKTAEGLGYTLRGLDPCGLVRPFVCRFDVGFASMYGVQTED